MIDFSKEDLILQVKAGADAVAYAPKKPHIAERILIVFGQLIGLKA
jgi:hypothetical protein